jgi:uncharacterized membrane protein YqaE (UPF0057 family)
VFHFAKVLQAIGIADVGVALWYGIVHDDMWMELYLALTGLGLFVAGRLLERRA